MTIALTVATGPTEMLTTETLTTETLTWPVNATGSLFAAQRYYIASPSISHVYRESSA